MQNTISELLEISMKHGEMWRKTHLKKTAGCKVKVLVMICGYVGITENWGTLPTERVEHDGTTCGAWNIQKSQGFLCIMLHTHIRRLPIAYHVLSVSWTASFIPDKDSLYLKYGCSKEKFKNKHRVLFSSRKRLCKPIVVLCLLRS